MTTWGFGERPKSSRCEPYPDPTALASIFSDQLCFHYANRSATRKAVPLVRELGRVEIRKRPFACVSTRTDASADRTHKAARRIVSKAAIRRNAYSSMSNTGDRLTAHLDLTLNSSKREVRWEGRIQNVYPDTNNYPVFFVRSR